MTTLNPCCAPVIVPTQPPLLHRWAQDAQAVLATAWRRWQDTRRTHAQTRTLAELPEDTLRDLGLAERRFDQPTLPRTDWQHGRW
jgi:uncharacterized protein YjiS (DUF1127 family)